MKLLLAVLSVIVFTQAINIKRYPSRYVNNEDNFDYDIDQEWTNFKKTYKRTFHLSSHEENRKDIFESNLKMILRHNNDYSKGIKSFKMAINQYADLTSDEFSNIMLSSKNLIKSPKRASTFLTPMNIDKLPEEIDWRKEGYVTPVKHQGDCGSCWAFSATGSLEGQHFRKTGKLVSLSEQNLLDCSSSFGNIGCNGGFVDMAFEYIKNNSGINTEESYPYKEKVQSCEFRKDLEGVTVTGFVDVEATEEKLQEAIATVGPISVGIDSHSESFRFYSGGVYDEPECNPLALGHSMLAVGYGSEDGKDYYLVKNSWGESWGLKGYIKMSRNKNNQCGIANGAVYPLV